MAAHTSTDERKRKRPNLDCTSISVTKRRCKLQPSSPSQPTLGSDLTCTDSHVVQGTADPGQVFETLSASLPTTSSSIDRRDGEDGLVGEILDDLFQYSEPCSNDESEAPTAGSTALSSPLFSLDVSSYAPGSPYTPATEMTTPLQGNASLLPVTSHDESTTEVRLWKDHIHEMYESQQAFTIYTWSRASHRKYKGPSSFQAFAQWLHVKSGDPSLDFSEDFRKWSQYHEEMDMPPSLYMPSLSSDHADYVNAFFEEVYPIFPVVGREDIMSAIAYLTRFDSLSERPVTDRPTMAYVYACIALGARSRGHSGIAQAFIEATCSLSGHLISLPYMQSAQALLLIGIEHLGRGKTGAAWQTLGQALRILNSMGLHKQLSDTDPHLSASRQQTDRRIWGIAYSLESSLALELGRPSSLDEHDPYQELIFGESMKLSPDFLQIYVELARIQCRIIRLFSSADCHSSSNPFAMLEYRHELDRALMQWSNNLPVTFAPQRGLFSCAPRLRSVRTFLMFQFYQAFITLHRSALVTRLPQRSNDYNSTDIDLEYARCWERSQSICANSARDILTTFLQYIKAGHSSPLVSTSQPLLAIYTLSIYMRRYPGNGSEEADGILLRDGLRAIKSRDQPTGCCFAIERLCRAVFCGEKSSFKTQGESESVQDDKEVRASVTTTRPHIPIIGDTDTEKLLEVQLQAFLDDEVPRDFQDLEDRLVCAASS